MGALSSIGNIIIILFLITVDGFCATLEMSISLFNVELLKIFALSVLRFVNFFLWWIHTFHLDDALFGLQFLIPGDRFRENNFEHDKEVAKLKRVLVVGHTFLFNGHDLLGFNNLTLF